MRALVEHGNMQMYTCAYTDAADKQSERSLVVCCFFFPPAPLLARVLVSAVSAG